MSIFSRRSFGALCQSRKKSTQLNLDTSNYIPRVGLKQFWQPQARPLPFSKLSAGGVQREVEKTHKCNKAWRSILLGRLWPSDDDDDNDIDDDNVYNQKDQCVIKALGGQNMTVCPIVVVPSQALRTGGESPFSGGTMFFIGPRSDHSLPMSLTH